TLIDKQLPDESDEGEEKKNLVSGLFDSPSPSEILSLIVSQSVIGWASRTNGQLPPISGPAGNATFLDYVALLRHCFDSLEVSPEVKLENEHSRHVRVLVTLLVNQLRKEEALSIPMTPAIH